MDHSDLKPVPPEITPNLKMMSPTSARTPSFGRQTSPATPSRRRYTEILSQRLAYWLTLTLIYVVTREMMANQLHVIWRR